LEILGQWYQHAFVESGLYSANFILKIYAQDFGSLPNTDRAPAKVMIVNEIEPS